MTDRTVALCGSPQACRVATSAASARYWRTSTSRVSQACPHISDVLALTESLFTAEGCTARHKAVALWFVTPTQWPSSWPTRCAASTMLLGVFLVSCAVFRYFRIQSSSIQRSACAAYSDDPLVPVTLRWPSSSPTRCAAHKRCSLVFCLLSGIQSPSQQMGSASGFPGYALRTFLAWCY
jgi:hypothetical protein